MHITVKNSPSGDDSEFRTCIIEIIRFYKEYKSPPLQQPSPYSPPEQLEDKDEVLEKLGFGLSHNV